MGRTRRFAPAWLPLLLAIGLPALAESPARPGGLAEAGERTAEALAHAATGLALSPDGRPSKAAAAALEEALRIDPLSRRAWRMLERQFCGPAGAHRRADVLAREARAFGTRSDWRRALSAGVAAEDEAIVREAVAALAAGVREANATRDSAADLGAAALALCRLGEGADALHPFRRYLALARDPSLVPPAQAPRTFAACARALAAAPAASEEDRLRAAEDFARLFRDAVLPCSPALRAEAFLAAAMPWSVSDDPAAKRLFRRLALDALRADPGQAETALFLALDDPPGGGGTEDGADKPSLADTLAKIDAFAARPEAAGLGYSFALAKALAAAHRADGADAAAATNALAAAEAAWAAARAGEPLPASHAAFRFETMLALGLETEALARAVAELPQDLRGLDPVFANNLAYTLACAGGDLDLAQRLADRSLAARPESPETLDTVGWILHLQGQEEDALEMLRRSIGLVDAEDPGSAEVFDHAGDVLAALGRLAEARAAWTHALSLALSDAIRAKLAGGTGKDAPGK
ncbi:MAG: hypothetical protein IJV65_04200 [Kiritimatiellae bacterium]|nr:hypothetical protein [Kiritimatiellia bacterium]